VAFVPVSLELDSFEPDFFELDSPPPLDAPSFEAGDESFLDVSLDVDDLAFLP
jgi:hypothetical protein